MLIRNQEVALFQIFCDFMINSKVNVFYIIVLGNLYEIFRHERVEAGLVPAVSHYIHRSQRTDHYLSRLPGSGLQALRLSTSNDNLTIMLDKTMSHMIQFYILDMCRLHGAFFRGVHF